MPISTKVTKYGKVNLIVPVSELRAMLIRTVAPAQVTPLYVTVDRTSYSVEAFIPYTDTDTVNPVLGIAIGSDVVWTDLVDISEEKVSIDGIHIDDKVLVSLSAQRMRHGTVRGLRTQIIRPLPLDESAAYGIEDEVLVGFNVGAGEHEDRRWYPIARVFDETDINRILIDTVKHPPVDGDDEGGDDTNPVTPPTCGCAMCQMLAAESCKTLGGLNTVDCGCFGAVEPPVVTPDPTPEQGTPEPTDPPETTDPEEQPSNL